MNIDQAIRIVATRGPVLPIQLVKELGGNTMIAGAVLSQLIDQKKVFVSKVKVGGSPLYYVKGQEIRLQEYSKNLNEKDLRAYNLLKEQKVLRDYEQDPLTRVCLRNIKDFATPLNVTFNDETEIFWKWYLLSDEDARDIIKQHLNIDEKLIEENKAKIEEKEEKESIPEKLEKQEDQKIENFGEDKKIENQVTEAKEKKADIIKEKKAEPEKTENNKNEENSRLVTDFETDDIFANKIISFLKRKDIIIRNIKIKKKNSEIDLNVLIPSAVGQIEYYCSAKNKKKISDSDISSTYVQGQIKKMPAMLLTTGDLTKSAKEMLSKEIKISVLKL